MIGRAPKPKPTLREFVELLMHREADWKLSRGYCRALGRRGPGGSCHVFGRMRDGRLRGGNRTAIDRSAQAKLGAAESTGRFRLGPPGGEFGKVTVEVATH